MKTVKLALVALVLASITSCGSGEGTAVQVSVSSNIKWTVPSKGISCYSNKTGLENNTTPEKDVTEAYFAIPTVSFQIGDKTKDTYISLIKIMYTPPNGSAQECAFADENLAALKASWWSSTNKVAYFPAGTADNAAITDCSIKCGGISVDIANFTASGTVKIYGYQVDPNDPEAQEGFVSTTYFTYGTQF
ncbi:hypothetical protein ACLVWU_14840 [Bdellovibrio sp. HCB290]|uniref:hypothetical protein n=1 Tax=Bdellovibrio sp. HCB290 TaxID=3394356 RepID=UPI0039B69116